MGGKRYVSVQNDCGRGVRVGGQESRHGRSTLASKLLGLLNSGVRNNNWFSILRLKVLRSTQEQK